MADGMRSLFGGDGKHGRPVSSKITTELIFRQDPVRAAEQFIARHELRVYFEPDWHLARRLATRFPHCLIFSIPIESNTASLHRVPGWRRNRPKPATK